MSEQGMPRPSGRGRFRVSAATTFATGSPSGGCKSVSGDALGWGMYSPALQVGLDGHGDEAPNEQIRALAPASPRLAGPSSIWPGVHVVAGERSGGLRAG